MLLAFLLFIPWYSFAYEPPDLNIHLEIRQMKEAKAPYFFGNNCIISYKEDHPIRSVGAAFEHEQYSQIHTFVKNEFDTFILIYPIETNSTIEELRYRIVVDGLWLADPHNPYTITDKNDIRISRIEVPDRLSRITSAPLVETNGRVKFIYKGPKNRNVYLVGDFNNWDPFMHKMRETNTGFYELSLHLLPGAHYYYFLSNGLKVLDPLNSDQGLDYEGDEASYFNFLPEGTGR